MGQSRLKLLLLALIIFFPVSISFAQDQSIPLIIAKQSGSNVSYSISLKIIAAMALLTVLPALLITTTAFTRIIIVFSILRQALGIPNVPSNQIMIGLSLIMTLFVMMPIIQKANEVSIQPYIENKITEQQALTGTLDLLKTFMMKQTHKSDLRLFMDLSNQKLKSGEEIPMLILMPAFITSELKTAFEIGFLIFLPFLIIDLVVSSILMSMGMMMLSPMVISLPFKLLFFVLVDGWGLIVASLITSFRA